MTRVVVECLAKALVLHQQNVLPQTERIAIKDLPFSTYAKLHAIQTPSPFLHVIRNRNV